MSIRDGKLLYHLTTLDVFESIVCYGLLSRGELNRRGLSFVDTANHEILYGRERLRLSDYIPFHFHHQTSYDTVVKSSHLDKTFIYIRISRVFAQKNGFRILPIHPTSIEQPTIYDYNTGFKLIDWDVMELTRAQAIECGIDERYHKQVRMAECLSPTLLDIDCFQSILVPDYETKLIVSDILQKYHKANLYVDVDDRGIYF